MPYIYRRYSVKSLFLTIHCLDIYMEKEAQTKTFDELERQKWPYFYATEIFENVDNQKSGNCSFTATPANFMSAVSMLKVDNNRKRQTQCSPEPSELVIKHTRKTKIGLQQELHLARQENIGQTPATLSINEHKAKIINQLHIEKLFKKDNDGDTMLHLTIIHKDEYTSKLLVVKMSEKTLDIFNRLRQTPLHLSVLTCQPTVVRYLVRHGANVNVTDRNGQTPLHLASKSADMDCVNAINEGIVLRRKYPGLSCDDLKCNLKNFQGQTALHLAVLSGSCEIAKKLLEMNATIDVQDGTSGRTPLHHAVEVHNVNMVEFLLKNKANVNARTFSGNTPLHTAMGRHMDGISQLLIKYGANINLKNVEGDTPPDVKVSRRWPSAVLMRSLRK